MAYCSFILLNTQAYGFISITTITVHRDLAVMTSPVLPNTTFCQTWVVRFSPRRLTGTVASPTLLKSTFLQRPHSKEALTRHRGLPSKQFFTLPQNILQFFSKYSSLYSNHSHVPRFFFFFFFLLLLFLFLLLPEECPPLLENSLFPPALFGDLGQTFPTL